MRIESIIFDFDGTLAELQLDFAEMKRRLSDLAVKFCAPVPPPAFLPVLEWLGWLENSIAVSNGGLAVGFRQKALDLVMEMEMESARKGSLFPFARPLLKELLQQGIKTAIITRNCDSAVRLVFSDILDYCSAFLARDHVHSPKPHPSHLILALESIHAQPATALMVGDHPMDIQTGKAAGVLTAGVCSGNTSREELLGAGPEWVAENCRDLITTLRGQGIILGR